MSRSVARFVGMILVLMAIVTPGAALAAGPAPIRDPEGFAEVRARFEGKSGEQIAAMGYIAEPPECVSDPELGGMGVHALNFPIFSEQFPEGDLVAEEPPIVLLDVSLQHVIGLEWEAADLGTGAPELFGQPALLLPGHPGPPGTDVPHYMLHAYFRPNGQVLFAPFDPQVSCLPDTATEGAAGSATGALLGLAIPLAFLLGLMVVAWFALDRRLLTRTRP